MGDRGWVGGGFSIRAKVTSGKREKEEEKKKNTASIPCERFSTAATNTQTAVNKKMKERKEEKYVFHCVSKTGSGDCGGSFEKQR